MDVRPVCASEVFDVSPGTSGEAVGGGWFGYLSYPDAGADGRGPRIPEAAGILSVAAVPRDAGVTPLESEETADMDDQSPEREGHLAIPW